MACLRRPTQHASSRTGSSSKRRLNQLSGFSHHPRTFGLPAHSKMQRRNSMSKVSNLIGPVCAGTRTFGVKRTLGERSNSRALVGRRSMILQPTKLHCELLSRLADTSSTRNGCFRARGIRGRRNAAARLLRRNFRLPAEMRVQRSLATVNGPHSACPVLALKSRKRTFGPDKGSVSTRR